MRKTTLKRTLCIVTVLCLMMTGFSFQSFAAAGSVKTDKYTVNGESYQLYSLSDKTYNMKRYYSDGYFMGDPKAYDPHLSTMSLSVAIEGDGTDKAFRSTMSALGYSSFHSNEFNTEGTSTADSIGYSIASKKLSLSDGTETEKTVVAVCVRGFNYDAEWASNFLLGTEGEAKGFAQAAETVNEGISEYIEKQGLSDQESEGNVLYWITGYSRGGAVSNLTAQRLITRLAKSSLEDKVFCYSFAVPQASRPDENSYDSIHNIVCNYDPVTYLAPASNWKFTRCGQTHDVTNTAFTNKWARMLNTLDSEYDYASEFHAAYSTLDLSSSDSILGLSSGDITDIFVENTEDNISLTDFISDLTLNLSSDDWIGTRENYATETYPNISGYNNAAVTFEDGLRTMIATYYELSTEDRARFIGCITNLGDAIDRYQQTGTGAQLALLLNILYLQKWNTDKSTSNKNTAIKFYWNLIDSSICTEDGVDYKLSDILSTDQYKRLKAAFPVLINVLMRSIVRDYDMQYADGTSCTDKRMYIMSTIIYNLTQDNASLFAFHYPIGYLAAVCVEDSFYDNKGEGSSNTPDRSDEDKPSDDTPGDYISGDDTPADDTVSTGFVDVKGSDYFYDAVTWAEKNSIIKGTDASHFSPDATATRAQFVTILWRYKGEPEPSGTDCNFKDANPDSYYYKAMIWAVEEGITKGTSSETFSPDSTISRAETVTFLWRYAGLPGHQDISVPFKDFDANDSSIYYCDPVNWAYSNAIVSGTSDTTLSPMLECSRAQLAAMLFRYDQNI